MCVREREREKLNNNQKKKKEFFKKVDLRGTNSATLVRQ